MSPDDDVCYCFHVSLRKLTNFARRVRPRYASQMSDCLGAGSGCGWCIPFLCKIAAHADQPETLELNLTAEEYAAARQAYRQGARRNQFSDVPPIRPAEPTAPPPSE